MVPDERVGNHWQSLISAENIGSEREKLTVIHCIWFGNSCICMMYEVLALNSAGGLLGTSRPLHLQPPTSAPHTLYINKAEKGEGERPREIKRDVRDVGEVIVMLL